MVETHEENPEMRPNIKCCTSQDSVLSPSYSNRETKLSSEPNSADRMHESPLFMAYPANLAMSAQPDFCPVNPTLLTAENYPDIIGVP